MTRPPVLDTAGDQALAAVLASRAEQDYEFRLDIVTSPEPDAPAAVVRFRADSIAAAVHQGRRFLAAHHGPDDRYGELYQRNGAWADYLTTIHLGA